MGKGLKSLAKKILEEEDIANGEGRPLDEEYDPLTGVRSNRSQFRSPNAAIIDQETRAIDELLAGIPKSQGYYLKLLKEVRPGEFEYKIRVDNWEGWTDMQDEVAKIVRGYTEKNKFNGRWGSGLYQVLVHRANGVRDNGKYKPLYFHIDAMEPDQQYQQPSATIQTNPTEALNTNIDMLTKLLDVVQKGNPSAGDNKAVYEKLADLKVDLAKTDSNNNVQMMNTAVNTLSQMLTAQMNKPTPEQKSAVTEIATLITALASTGLLDKLKSTPKEDPLDTIAKLKSAGLIPDPKKEDVFDMLAKLKAAGLIPDLNKPKEVDPIERTLDLMQKLKPLIDTGKPNSDPLWFKLVDSFAPHALKLGGEILSVIRENSKRRFISPTSTRVVPAPGRAINPPIQFEPQGQTEPPITRKVASGVFDENDERLMQQQRDFINRRNAAMQGREPIIPENEVPIAGPVPIREENVIPLPNFEETPVATDSQQTPQTQEQIAMQIFQQMKIARDRNDSAYFHVLRELIISQAGDNVYDGLIEGTISMQQIFSNVRSFAGAWIDEPATANYFKNFLIWARAQKVTEVVAYCAKCDEEVVFPDLTTWNASNKLCQVCQSPLQLEIEESQDVQNAIDVDNLISTAEGDSNAQQ